MQQEKWNAVDRYIQQRLAPSDAALDATLRANSAAGLPAIDVAPNQGKLLNLLALLVSAKRILEIGTLGGYSTIWLARALPANGRLITLEFESRHAEVAAANIERAGLSAVVEVRLGRAVDSLAQLEREGAEPFDLVFIDADKENCRAYLEWSLKLCRRGSVIVCDNVIRDGAIVEAESTDPRVQGVRAFFDRVAAEPRLSGTALQTVGSKGYDGFALAVVTSD